MKYSSAVILILLISTSCLSQTSADLLKKFRRACRLRPA
jgi:hypothetical protein